MKNVRMAEGMKNFDDGNFITLTFCVTQDCNLACKYCYMVGKNEKHRMELEMGKKIVDFVLEDEYINHLSNNVIFDFIGGEPLIEIEMISELCDYIVLKMYKTNHKWLNNYAFNFSSNGTLYGKDIVRKYINKHGVNCNIGISIDGTKEKHDLNRVKKDGTGSYDDIEKIFPLYFEEFPNSGTKSTFASEDLKYLKDSIIHLWNLGIKDVSSNLVYEDVWKEGDPELFENQLKELADYVLDNELYDEYAVSYFEPKVGLPIAKEDLNQNRCGAGYKSLAFDNKGNIYPCVHFIEMCFDNENHYKKSIIGNIYDGIDKEKLIPYAATSWRAVSPEKCLNCEVGTGCGWCLAVDLDQNGSILERTTAICEMHKANARANKYFWKEYEKRTGCTSAYTLAKVSKEGLKDLKYLYFITADNIQPHCSYQSNKNSQVKIPTEIFNKGIDFCIENSLIPVFLGDYNHGFDFNKRRFYEIKKAEENNKYDAKDMIIFDKTISVNNKQGYIGIYLLSKQNLNSMENDIITLLKGFRRINLFIEDINLWSDYDVKIYEQKLDIILEYLVSQYKSGNKIQFNIITDLNMHPDDYYSDCGAGITSIALAPNGKFYVCPGIYFSNPEINLGDFYTFNKNYQKKLAREKSARCVNCKKRLCNRCLYQNITITKELTVPSDIQCKVSYINEKKSKDFISKTSPTYTEKLFVGYIDELLNRDLDVFGVLN